jgi:putative phage-type endonuclease
MKKFLDSKILYNTKNMSKAEWLEKRRCGIGGSDASSIVNMSPFRSRASVYIDKLHSNDYEECKNESFRMDLGNKLEDFVAREFMLRTGKKVRNVNGILQNDKYPFAIANIDRYVFGEKAILECKVTNSFQKKEWEKQVPIHYQIQCLHYMAVTGASCCYVAALIGNEDFVIHKLDRDEELITYLMEEEEKFWKEYILGDKVPIPDGSEDYSRILRNKYKNPKSESIILFMKEEKISRYDEVLKLIKELDLEKKYIEQVIQSEMGDYEVAFVGDRKITWKNQSRSSFDTKRFKAENPEVASGYLKSSTSRVFRVHG